MWSVLNLGAVLGLSWGVRQGRLSLLASKKVLIWLLLRDRGPGPAFAEWVPVGGGGCGGERLGRRLWGGAGWVSWRGGGSWPPGGSYSPLFLRLLFLAACLSPPRPCPCPWKFSRHVWNWGVPATVTVSLGPAPCPDLPLPLDLRTGSSSKLQAPGEEQGPYSCAEDVGELPQGRRCLLLPTGTAHGVCPPACLYEGSPPPGLHLPSPGSPITWQGLLAPSFS